MDNLIQGPQGLLFHKVQSSNGNNSSPLRLLCLHQDEDDVILTLIFAMDRFLDVQDGEAT